MPRAAKSNQIRRRRKGKKGRQRNLKSYILLFILITAAAAVLSYFQVFDESSPIVDGEIFVHFIDVGQGDAILVQNADNAVLIDSGPRGAEADLIAYLRSQGVHTLDVVVATHPHADHIGSKPGILDNFNVLEVWMPDAIHTTLTFERFIDAIYRNDIEVSRISAGDRLRAGQIQMMAVAPGSSGHNNLNNYCIVLHMVYGETAFLFTGDAEAYTEEKILRSGRNIRADVMLAGHHGSHTSSTDAFLDAVGAHTAVISAGANNRYGHPHGVVLNRLQARNMDVLRTDLHGTIVFATDGETIRRYR